MNWPRDGLCLTGGRWDGDRCFDLRPNSYPLPGVIGDGAAPRHVDDLLAGDVVAAVGDPGRQLAHAALAGWILLLHHDPLGMLADLRQVHAMLLRQFGHRADRLLLL